ncbi:MAG TPA: C45 family peptidase [Actinomycetales bacterium]|nr:C45 family peptidase [Actinomycetales bacterium]
MQLCTHPAQVRATWEIYSQLFRAAGLHDSSVRELADGCLAALADWAPDLADEVETVARESQLLTWQVAALTGRTEVLAGATAMGRGECSTVVDVRGAGPVLGAQTWDWHRDLADSWYVTERPRTADRLAFVTLTEYGVPAKIGVNAAGVGLLLNILGHETDGEGEGVPVHALCRRVLDTATDLDEALDIVRSAPVSASSCLTVLDRRSAAAVEFSPAGVVSRPPEAGFVVHTNHFTDERLAEGEERGRAEPDTYDRYRLLRQRLSDVTEASDRDALVDVLDAHPAAGAEVCCHPPAGAPFAERWETLATVVLDPERVTMWVHRGGPCTARATDWQRFSPPQ